MDCSLPGSSVHGIFQARVLEWVAISFSNAWKWKVKVKLLSHLWLLATPWTAAHQAPQSMGFSRQEYWSGVPLPSLRERLLPSLIDDGLLFFWPSGMWDLNHLTRDQTSTPCIGRGSLNHWTTRKSLCGGKKCRILGSCRFSSLINLPYLVFHELFDLGGS